VDQRFVQVQNKDLFADVLGRDGETHLEAGDYCLVGKRHSVTGFYDLVGELQVLESPRVKSCNSLRDFSQIIAF
jgi:hypothetical protein